MSFFFQSCFETDNVNKDFTFEKSYNPKASLLPEQIKLPKTKQEIKVTTIPNKFLVRGNYDRPGYIKDFEQTAILTQHY